MVKFTVEILHETMKNNFGLLAPDNPPICKPKSQTDPKLNQIQLSTSFKYQPYPNLNRIQISARFKSQPDPNLNQTTTETKSQPKPTKLNYCLGQPNQTI